MGMGDHVARVLAAQQARIQPVAREHLIRAATDLVSDARARWYTRVRVGRDGGRSGEAFYVEPRTITTGTAVALGNRDLNVRYIHAAGTSTPLLEELLLEPARRRAASLAQSIAADIVRTR